MPRSITAMALPRRRPHGLALLAASVAGAAGLLAGCSSGQVSQTAAVVPPVPGINVDAGPVAIRDATIAYGGPEGYPAGGTAPLVLRVFSNRTTGPAIRLTGARLTGEVTGRVVLVGGAPSTGSGTAAPASGGPGVVSGAPGASAGSARPSPSATATRQPSPSVSASAGARPSASAPPSAGAGSDTGSTAISVPIPNGGYVLLVPGTGGYLAVTGLSAPLRPGATLSLELTFDLGTGTPLRVDVTDIPLAPPASPGPRSPVPMGSGGAGE